MKVILSKNVYHFVPCILVMAQFTSEINLEGMLMHKEVTCVKGLKHLKDPVNHSGGSNLSTLTIKSGIRCTDMSFGTLQKSNLTSGVIDKNILSIVIVVPIDKVIAY